MEKVKDWRIFVPLKRELCDLHCAGGVAHNVIDDGNLSDADINYCIRLCKETSDWEPEVCQASLNLLLAMKQLSRTQRKKLYLHWDGPAHVAF